MDPERHGIILAKHVVDHEPHLMEKAKELVQSICGEMLYEAAVDIRCDIEKELGLSFKDEEAHYEFAQAFEGDIRRALTDLLVQHINDY